MNERLQQFLAAENISQSQFAETIGVARASVSHILAGRNRPGYDFICSLLEHYPSLNSEWILMGKGKMYKGPAVRPAQTEAPEPQQAIDGPRSAQAAYAPQPQQAQPAAGYVRPDSGQPQPSAAPVRPEPVSAPLEARTDENGTMIQESLFAARKEPEIHASAPAPQAASAKTVSKIIVFYSDNTFQELKG